MFGTGTSCTSYLHTLLPFLLRLFWICWVRYDVWHRHVLHELPSYTSAISPSTFLDLLGPVRCLAQARLARATFIHFCHFSFDFSGFVGSGTMFGTGTSCTSYLHTLLPFLLRLFWICWVRYDVWHRHVLHELPSYTSAI